MTETHHTFCRICESLCGLDVTVEDGRITQIRPDGDHVATGGFACIKGIKQHQLYGSPDRLTHPGIAAWIVEALEFVEVRHRLGESLQIKEVRELWTTDAPAISR